MRFASAHDKAVGQESREHLLTRLDGTLGADGKVEIYLRKGGTIYVLERTFTPLYASGGDKTVTACTGDPLVYRYDEHDDQLIPEEKFEFAIDVYEQGRIHDLRSDVHRQLEMLDEFAGLAHLKSERHECVRELRNSAAFLAPLYEERERLKSELAQLPTLTAELDEKLQLLPGEERELWANSETFVAEIEAIIEAISAGVARIPKPSDSLSSDVNEPLHQVFAQRLPELDLNGVVHADVLDQWREIVRKALNDLEAARKAIVDAVELLTTASGSQRQAWTAAKDDYDRLVSERLRRAGVASPRELIESVSGLRKQVITLEHVKQPRLSKVERLIEQAASRYQELLTALQQVNTSISTMRQATADDLTKELGEYVQIKIKKHGDRESYYEMLREIAMTIGEGRIKNRDAQVRMVVDKVLPIVLVRTLLAQGYLPQPQGLLMTLTELCGITENTQTVLCGAAKDVRILTALATAEVADVPQISVRRRGEESFADLRTGLSPGEQSAALLTLALQTRTAPLILDQPEDELGYSYVVHLIVPKILQAKFKRQLLVVTHNANIPVLGDADLIIKMENHPISENDRRCLPAVTGSFEMPTVTASLLELEGGAQAFQYRQHRYAIPRAAS